MQYCCKSAVRFVSDYFTKQCHKKWSFRNHCSRKQRGCSNGTAPYQLSLGKSDMTAGSALCPSSLKHPSRKWHIMHTQTRQAYINYTRKVMELSIKQKFYFTIKIILQLDMIHKCVTDQGLFSHNRLIRWGEMCSK